MFTHYEDMKSDEKCKNWGDRKDKKIKDKKDRNYGG